MAAEKVAGGVGVGHCVGVVNVEDQGKVERVGAGCQGFLQDAVTPDMFKGDATQLMLVEVIGRDRPGAQRADARDQDAPVGGVRPAGAPVFEPSQRAARTRAALAGRLRAGQPARTPARLGARRHPRERHFRPGSPGWGGTTSSGWSCGVTRRGTRHHHYGLAWGFADTPEGALLAAVNIGVRANAQWGPGIFGPTIRGQVTGLGAGALLAGCQASYAQEAQAAGVTGGGPLGRAYVTEQAFRWVAYTPAGAAADIVSAGPGPQGGTARAVTRIEVWWAGGDWRVIAPPGGDWGNSAAPVTSLRGYIPFPGQP